MRDLSAQPVRVLIARWMPSPSPSLRERGPEFARACVGMKAVETIVSLRREEVQYMRPKGSAHLWNRVHPNRLTPTQGEPPRVLQDRG